MRFEPPQYYEIHKNYQAFMLQLVVDFLTQQQKQLNIPGQIAAH